jgi:carbonic anhydrase
MQPSTRIQAGILIIALCFATAQTNPPHADTAHENTSAPQQSPKAPSLEDSAHGNAGSSQHAQHAPANTPDPLTWLLQGNSAFVNQTMLHPNQTTRRRLDIAQSQQPSAVIVCCSDSRVSPEVIFDKGLGDLFVVRTAGNVVTAVEIGSIEYGVEHLGATLVMVLGHKRCGAVKATVEGGEAPPNIKSIITLIQPAVDIARTQSGDLLDNAIKNNVVMVSETIKRSAVIEPMIKQKRVRVVEAFYNFDDGTVKVRK